MLQVVVPIWLQNLEIWGKQHTCELVGKRKSPKRQKVFCRFADVRTSCTPVEVFYSLPYQRGFWKVMIEEPDYLHRNWALFSCSTGSKPSVEVFYSLSHQTSVL